MKIFKEQEIRARYPGRNLSESEVLEISNKMIAGTLKAAKANKIENWKRLAMFIVLFVLSCGLITTTPFLAVVGSLTGAAAMYKASDHFKHILKVNSLITRISSKLDLPQKV